jgi:hypothetical protein
MKQQFIVLEKTEKKTWQIRNRPIFNLSTPCFFLRKYKEKKSFCGCKILVEGVFVNQLSSNAGISI